MYEALMPNYAMGQQVRKDDERIKTSYETVPSPNGNGYIRGYFARPYSADSRAETATKLPGILVIHENRGLNPHTEDVARRFALANFNAFAPDCLTSMGGYPGDDYKGGLPNALAGMMGDELAAAAPFYGGQTPAAEVPKVKAAILIHHGGLDKALC